MQRTKCKTIKLILIAALVIVYVLPIQVSMNMWYYCFVYQFFHANIFHLLANLYALYLIRLTKERVIASYIISIFPVLLFPGAIGISGMLLSIIGMYSNKKTWMQFSIFSLITFFIPNMAFAVHTVCFVLGSIYGKISIVLDDYQRAYTGR